MKRMSTFLLAAALLALVSPARGEDRHARWLSYLAGQWTQTLNNQTSQDEETGIGDIRFAAKETALYNATDRAVSMWGWDSARQALIFTGFHSSGLHWHIAFTNIEEDQMSGLLRGSEEGHEFAGGAVLKRRSDDEFSIMIDRRNEDGTLERGLLVCKRKKGNIARKPER